MYSTLLVFHSIFRWLVLLSLLYVIITAFKGWLGNKTYTKIDNVARLAAVTIAHIQLILGLTLYFISPIVSYFLNNFSKAVHERQIRFFGMEHSLVMLVAIVLLTIGSSKAKRKRTDVEKYKTLAIWFTVALLLILSSIPWSFSPLVSRPLWRGF